MPETTLALPYAEHAAPVTGEPAWAAQRRAEAWQRFATSGFPSAKQEGWQHADLKAMTTEHARAGRTAAPERLLAANRIEGVPRIVFVNGILDAAASDPVPDGARIGSLADFVRRDDDVARVHLGQAPGEDPFADLTQAVWSDGAFVDVPPAGEIAALHILHVRVGPGAAFPRSLIHVQEGGRATIIESFVGDDAAGHSFAFTELTAHPGATLQHVSLQDEAAPAHHLHTVFARADRDATLASARATLGAGSSRFTLNAKLAGAGAQATLHGLYLPGDGQRMDHWTRVDHAVPNASSEESYRGVLQGTGRSGFTGNVLVQAGADGTSAKQENRNLLLSRKALAASEPQLEIHADDVQCSHGSTTGQLDKDALFFLQSRGIAADDARRMLVRAFAAQTIEALPLSTLRTLMAERLDAWLEAA